VAPGTRHILVRTLQGERRSPIVVKVRRLPAIEIVATGAIRDVPAAGELAPMRITVAARTLFRGDAKVHVLQRRFQSGWTMAINTCNASMCPEQRKVSLGMIEAVEFFPLNSGMACLASRSPAVRALCCHSFAELAGMWIVMARRAGAILKPEFHGND
jgi:hypothetical protein